METIGLALRSLLKAPGFTAVAVLALALGIGANSVIFSIVNAIFLRPLPYANPHELVQLTSTLAERNLEGVGFSWPRLLAVRERQTVFSQLAVSAQTGFTITGEGDPEQVQGMQVSHEFFPVLGVQPALGRAFLPEEDRAGGEPVAILSHGLWERRFGARADIIGKPILLDGNPHTIIGVMPQSLSRFPMGDVAVWTARPDAVTYLVREQIDSGGFFFNVLGRLRPGATLEAARAQVASIASAYAQAYPTHVDAPSSADVEFVLEGLIGEQRLTYGLLFAAVACVLLIACANVANLVLARHAGRRKQTAIRFALGARRRHVIAGFVVENVLLALAGGAVGLGLAAACLQFVLRIGADFIPRVDEVALDPLVVAFTLGLSLLTGVALGLVPAVQVARGPLTEPLMDSSRGTTGGRGQARVRSGLLVAEVAVSFVLLIVASLLINSFVRVRNVAPGFDPEGVFAGFVQVPATQYPERSEVLVAFYRNLLRELEAIPGAESVALNDSPPLSGAGPSPYAVVGSAIPPLAQQALALRHIVSPNAFGVLGVPILKGRDFGPGDSPTSTPVVIINETMARQAFPDRDPIGQRIVSGMLQLTQEVVGVVADTHSQDLTTAPTAEMYYPILQRPENVVAVLVRTQGDPAALAGSVRAALKAVDPGIPLAQAATMAQFVEQSMADRRLTMAMLAAFAGLALALASLGVYSVMAYTVGQRSGEIGVRMALGARGGDVRSMVVRHGLALTGLGVAIGVAAALVLTRLINTLLFGVGAGDPLTYLGISALLAMVAVAACWLPAQRAARVDPMVALRGD